MESDSFSHESVAVAFSDWPDASLLVALVHTRNERFFDEIFRRHARMVLGVCESVLHHQQDAEGAAQRTWVVLYQRAASICKGKSVQSWLHGVANRIAWNMQLSTMRREKHERPGGNTYQTGQNEHPVDELIHREEEALIDAEVQRLPEKLRICIMLRYLDGKNNREIAQQLGWKEGTVASRMARAHTMLRPRLKKLE